MDDASIHAGQEADIVEDLLWQAVQAVVAFLPTAAGHPSLQTPLSQCFALL